jgi:hypothetical protein
MHVLNIADGLKVDLANAIGQRIALIGKSGSGKTNTLLVMASEWNAAGQPFTFIDPMAAAITLPQSAPVILAGRRKSAHVVLSEANAAELARLSLNERISIVLDMSLYQDDEAEDILSLYLRALWGDMFNIETPAPYALIIDEAQLYAPQADTTRLRPLIIDMAKRGRHKSLTTMVATQRAASIVKDFLTQATLLIAHRLSFGVDTKILREQLPIAERELNGMMRKLKTGQALILAEDRFIGDDDYRTVQVRRHEAVPAEVVTDVTGAPIRAIDEAILAALDKLSSMKPKADIDEEASPDVDGLHQQISQLETKVEELETALAQAYGERDDLRNEVQRLTQQQVAGIPLAVNGALDVRVHQNPLWQSPAPLFEQQPDPIPELVESPYRSPAATARAIRKQERGFSGLLEYVGSLQRQYRMWLAYLVDHENMSFSPRELARFTGYSETTIVRFLPDLVRREMVTRRKNGSATLFQVAIRSLFERDYPDLDTETLIDRFQSVLK